MKKFLLFLIILTLFYGLYTSFFSKKDAITTTSSPQVSAIKIRETTYQIEIADTDSERAKGLSGRDSLPHDYGMLFLFDTKDYWAFWMKDTRIPLDFIWIADNEIVDITENVPVPVGNYYPRYQPKLAVNKVLEVNAGEVKKHGIQIGDIMTVTLFQPNSSP